jgi:hypothetical protein
VLEDEVGLQLLAPGDGWRRRPDMDPDETRRARASIVVRARFIEARHVSAASLAERYFAGRTDGLRPSSAEELLVATT